MALYFVLYFIFFLLSCLDFLLVLLLLDCQVLQKSRSAMKAEARERLKSGTPVGGRYDLARWMANLNRAAFDRPSTVSQVPTASPHEDRRDNFLTHPKFSPILHEGPRHTRPLLFCTIPKNGCSLWRRLLRKAQGIPDWRADTHAPETSGLSYLSQLRGAAAAAALADPFRLRVAVVRSPFARVLSAYLNKRDAAGLPPTFGRFLREVIDGRCEALYWYAEHWMPQSQFGGLRSIEYDFVGHVEDMAEWGDALLRRTGLYDASRSGWGGAEGTFFHGSKTIGATATGAANLMTKYYTPELVELVMDNYYEDVVRFGYYENYLELLAAVQ